MPTKDTLRKKLRAARNAHFAEIPANMRGLLFRRPPAALATLIPHGATIGLYHEMGAEAPATGYARWLMEDGHPLSLPRFAGRDSAMEFAAWENPWDDDELISGPFTLPQPRDDAPAVIPDVVFCPLLGFTGNGARIGQGGGHYDRWLAAHPDVIAIGLAWDAQLCDDLPVEPHDRPLHAVVTPTRLYGPFQKAMQP